MSRFRFAAFLICCTYGVSGYSQESGTTSSMAQPIIPNPDFELVTSKLEKGGSIYFYADLEGALESLITQFEPMLRAIDDPTAKRLPDIARQIVKTSGLDQFSDIGVSLVDLQGGMRRMKSYFHIKRFTGLLEIAGGAPGKLDGMAYIPQEATISYCSTINLHHVTELAEEIGNDIKGSEGREAVQGFLDTAKKRLGADVKSILGSTGNETAGWLRLDPEKTVKIANFSVPETGAVLMLKVKDRTIFDVLKKQISSQGAKISELTNVEGLEASMVLEVPENPFNFRPVIGQVNGWLMMASSSRELERALEAAKSGKDIRQSPDFQRLAAGLPVDKNGVVYVSPELGNQIGRFSRQLSSNAMFSGGASVWGAQLERWSKFAGAVSVRVNDEAGCLEITQGEVHASQAMQAAVSGVATAGILAAIAVPNFLEAQVRAKVSRAKNDMRSMATGLESYYVDNNAYPPSTAARGKTSLHTANGKPVSSFAGPQLTTPVAYLTALYKDPFAEIKDATFGYYNPGKKGDESGWLLFSAGPDTKYDFGWEVYDLAKKQPSVELITGYSYDPTNGTVSPGDVWRVKQ